MVREWEWELGVEAVGPLLSNNLLAAVDALILARPSAAFLWVVVEEVREVEVGAPGAPRVAEAAEASETIEVVGSVGAAAEVVGAGSVVEAGRASVAAGGTRRVAEAATVA